MQQDIINKTKNKINKIYANKFFKVLFFLLFLIIAIYKYSNVADIVKNKNSLNTDKTPQKINVLKKIQDNVHTDLIIKKRENDNINMELEKIKLISEKKEKKREEAEKMAESLKKEFIEQIKPKTNRRIKINDIVEIKFIITNGNDFNIKVDPIIIPVEVTKEENNIFGRHLLNKRVGEVVNIPFIEFMQEPFFKNAINKVTKEQNLKTNDLKLDVLSKSNMIYRIKIIKFIN